MNNYHAGHFAEKIARWYLFFKGYRLIAQNYITGRGTNAGEIDLIVCRGKTLVFVEVKKRSSPERAAYAVLPAQQRRIRRAAEVFIAKHPQFKDYNIRFDAFLVCFPCRFLHLISVF